MAAIEAADDLGEFYSDEDLLEELDDPELGEGGLVGAFEDDRMVGYWGAIARGESEGRFRVHCQGGVAPDRRGRGLGTELIAAMVTHADSLHLTGDAGKPAIFQFVGRSDNEPQRDALTRTGFVAERWTFGMQVRLADAPTPVPAPAGYRIRGYQPNLDDAMRNAHNAAFLDHPNFAPWSPERWTQWGSGSHNFRPTLSFVVVPDSEPGNVVAYVETKEFDADTAATGLREAYVAKLGTVRGHRGSGLASMLLLHMLAACREQGFAAAALDVDSENPTGALGIYERAGFRVVRRFTEYCVHRPPVRS